MADTVGSDQAQTMLRRVSPEGRARAARERQRLQQRRFRLWGRLVLLALAAAALIGMADLALGALPEYLIGAILILFLVTAAMTGYRSRPRRTTPLELRTVSLTALPAAAAAWLEGQQAALPAPAIQLSDDLAARLRELAPQLGQLDVREPAAEAVRRLVEVELPDLIERHQRVPLRLRDQMRGDSSSADSHLVNGLRIINEEVARMTTQLARGDVDALATRDRFLELKYQNDGFSGI